MIKKIYNSQAEVIKSGPFLLMEKMYNESYLHLKNSNHMNTKKKTMDETSKTHQIDKLDLNNENEISKDNNIDKNEDWERKMKNKNIRTGDKTNDSTNLSNYSTNPPPKYHHLIF